MPVLVKGNNTMFFFNKTYVPANMWRDVTYGKIVVDYIPENTDPYRTRLTVGGGRVNNPGDCGTTTV